MIRVFLADDRPVMLEGLKRLLKECADLQVVGEAVGPDQLLARLRSTGPDVLLVDVSFAPPSLFVLLRRLKQEQPAVRVLVLGVENEGQHAWQALWTGAAGYLARSDPPGELVAAIRSVAGGDEYLSPTVVERFFASWRVPGQSAGYRALSRREYQVLCMFGVGRAFSEIAAELGLSRKTVSTYRRRLLEKLRLRTNADLIRYAMEHRLVT